MEINMTSPASLSALLTIIVRWAANSPHILAVALVGSYARGAARADSDIDLMLITSTPETFRQETQWLQQIDWEHIQAHITTWKDADYGLVWSRHTQLSNGTEIELSFGPPQWAATNPIDTSTYKIVSAGCWILLDPTGLLNHLLQQVNLPKNQPSI
jgi:predicted nucleotidyltransferase